MVTIILLFFSLSALGMEGTVIALEAPLFKSESKNSKIIQRVRKGDLVFIHPQEAFQDKYQGKVRISAIRNENIQIDKNDDLLIGDDVIYRSNDESDFLKTLTRDGQEAFILKKHVWINYDDVREINQKVPKKDVTDYRIQEPLIEGYPIIQEYGYRGQMTYGFGRANISPFDFKKEVLDTSSNFTSEFSGIWSYATEENENRRVFLGVKIAYYLSEQEYLLDNQTAQMKFTNLSLGPYISYDFYRSRKNIINVYAAIMSNIVDNLAVTVTDDSNTESRDYSSSYSFSGNAGLAFHRLRAIGVLDIIAGFNMNITPGRSYAAETEGEQTDFWNNTGKSDAYNRSLITELSTFIGIQSYY